MYAIQKSKKTMKYFIVFAITLLAISNMAYSQSQNVSQIKYKGEILTKKNVLQTLSKSLTKDELKTIEPYVSKSFQGINQKNKALTDKGIHEFKNFMTNVSRISLNNKWQDCGTYCDSKDDPASYGFCYWKCIFNGGPSKINRITKDIKLNKSN